MVAINENNRGKKRLELQFQKIGVRVNRIKMWHKN